MASESIANSARYGRWAMDDTIEKIDFSSVSSIPTRRERSAVELGDQYSRKIDFLYCIAHPYSARNSFLRVWLSRKKDDGGKEISIRFSTGVSYFECVIWIFCA